MAPVIFFFFQNHTLKSLRSARCSDLDAHVTKEVWQLFCVLIWKRQRSVFTGRLLAAKLQRREIFLPTDSLFLGFMASVTCFIGLLMDRFQLEKGWISERHTCDAISKSTFKAKCLNKDAWRGRFYCSWHENMKKGKCGCAYLRCPECLKCSVSSPSQWAPYLLSVCVSNQFDSIVEFLKKGP